MNYIKIQQDLIKLYLADKLPRCFLFEDEKSVSVSADGYVIYRIPKIVWVLDSKLFIGKFGASSMIQKLTDINDNYRPAVDTGERRRLVSVKGNAIKLQADDGTICWINEKFLKYFENPLFKIKDKLSPVAVYEEDMLAGMICAVRVENENNKSES